MESKKVQQKIKIKRELLDQTRTQQYQANASLQESTTKQYMEHYRKTILAFFLLALYVGVSQFLIAHSIFVSPWIVSVIALLSIGATNGYVAYKYHKKREKIRQELFILDETQERLQQEVIDLQNQYNQVTRVETSNPQNITNEELPSLEFDQQSFDWYLEEKEKQKTIGERKPNP